MPLSKSRLFFLTKLNKTQLCGLLHGREPAAILGTAAGPASYQDTGQGVICTWTGGGAELYIGISTILGWQSAQPIDKLAGDRPIVIYGHKADAGPPNKQVRYAAVHVATAGPNDPVVEFRAPTLAMAIRLANTVMPRLLAITSGP